MERSGVLKYYIGAAILVVLIIVIAFVSHSSPPRSPAPQSQTSNTLAATPTTTVATTSATDSSSANTLVGTWNSATAGKGMQGSGTITVSGTSYQLSMDGDVDLVIKKIENGSAIGTISYKNLCITTVVSAPGKDPVTKAPQCINTTNVPATIQVSGSTLTFVGKSAMGSDISFNGNFADNAITGTFSRSSSYGKITGTFSLSRAQ